MAVGVASGALSLFDPAKFHPGVRAGLVLGTGAASGALFLKETVPAAQLGFSQVARGAWAVGLATTGSALMGLAFVADAKLQRELVRRGVTHPRAVIAVGSGILSTALTLLDPAVAGDGPECSGQETDEPVDIALTKPVRELLAGMLRATDQHGSAILQEQLKTAGERHWGDPTESWTRYQPYFTVAEAAPRTVPRDYTFPVHAHFNAEDGTPLRLSLLIDEGRLGSLMLELDPGTDAAGAAEAAHGGHGHEHDEPSDLISRWPLPGELIYRLEG